MYKLYVLYPKIVKDIVFIIHQNISFDEFKKWLYINRTEYLSEINLLDQYLDDSIPEEHVILSL